MQGWGRAALQSTKKNALEKKVQKGNTLGVPRIKQTKWALREYRSQLEKDIEKLQKKLKQEVDTHKALERAFRRTLGVLPRFSPGLAPKIQELLAEVAVLEEEVINLEECIVLLRQGLYNEAVYLSTSRQQKQSFLNSTSTFSKEGECPKLPLQIRHFQNDTKGRRNPVIAKLLPPVAEKKADKSLGVTGRPTNGDKRRLQNSILVQGKSGGKNSDHAIQGSIKALSDGDGLTPRINMSCQSNGLGAQEVGMEKENEQKLVYICDNSLSQFNSVKVDTRKTLRQAKLATSYLDSGSISEPNLLSQEMVWCLSHLFLRLTRPCSFSDCETSSTISHSTLSSVWSCTSRNSFSYNPSTDVTEEIEFPDPYRICVESAPRDIGLYRYYHEVTSKSMDYSRIPRSAGSLRKLMCLVEKLSTVDLRGLTHQQKLAFWINIYNVCMMHAFLEHGIPNSPHKIVALMDKAAINVGGHFLSALAIEHFILRLPSDIDNTELKSREKKAEGMMRSTYGLEWPEPLVSFALCCGSWSSPAVRVYTPLEVENELEIAKAEYLQAAVGVTPTKVLIPKLLDWYMRDFAKDLESLIDWIAEQLPSPLAKSVQKCLACGQGKAMSELVEVMPYDFNFRYLFAMQPV